MTPVMAEIETLKREFDAAVERLQAASTPRSRSCSAATNCRRA